MIQIAICIDKSAKEIEKQTNEFFKNNKDKIKYVDIKYQVNNDAYGYVMIIYDLIEENKNTITL